MRSRCSPYFNNEHSEYSYDVFGVLFEGDFEDAGIVVKGIADMTLNYGILVSGLLGEEESGIPSDIVNTSVDAFTGNDETSDAFEEVVDHLIGEM